MLYLFQPQQLVNKIKQCSVLEADTQIKLKSINDSHLELSDAEALCANLKGNIILILFSKLANNNNYFK